MYPFSGPPYSSSLSHPGQPSSYPRFSSLYTGSSQPSGISSISALVSPLSNLTSSFASTPQSQVLSHQPFYLSHPGSTSSLGMSESELGSPDAPISPQESLSLDEASSNKDAESPLFDFPGYTMPPLQLSRPSGPVTMPTSSYFTPSFPFSATPAAGLSSCNTLQYAPPPPIYNQFADSSAAVLSANEAPLISSHGISPYPALPTCMGNRMHPHKSVSKLSYDSPRFKLTPERAVPLLKWFEEHKDHPYPTRHEKILLCQTTQLTFTQVSTWFANARRRMKKASSEDDDVKSSSPCSSPGYNEVPSPSDSPQEYVQPTTVSASSIVHVVNPRENTQDLNDYESEESSSKVYWDSAVYSTLS